MKREHIKKNSNFNKARVLKKYLARYLSVVLLVILCCIPFGINTFNKIKEYAIVTSVRQLEDGIQRLNSDVEKMQMIASMLGEDTHLLELKRITGEIPMEKYLYLKDVKDRLSEISHIYDFSENIFCIFRNNDAFVSNNQVSDNLPGYYGTYISADDMTWDMFRNTLLNQCDESAYLPVTNFSYFESDSDKLVSLDNAVLYVQPAGRENYWSSRKAVIVFAVGQERFLDLLLPEEMQNDSLLLVTDQTGQEIVSYGRDIEALRKGVTEERIRAGSQTYQIFQYDHLPYGLTVTAGFPMNSIYDQVINIGKLLLLYILCGGAVAVILTVICTLYWYRPFGKMLDEVSRLSGGDLEKNNEYDYVRESLLKLVSDKDEMETKMLLVNAEKQAIMLEKVFLNGFSEPELCGSLPDDI